MTVLVCAHWCECVRVCMCVYVYGCVSVSVCVCLRFSVVVLNSGPQAPALYRFLFQPGPTKTNNWVFKNRTLNFDTKSAHSFLQPAKTCQIKAKHSFPVTWAQQKQRRARLTGTHARETRGWNKNPLTLAPLRALGQPDTPTLAQTLWWAMIAGRGRGKHTCTHTASPPDSPHH